MTLFQHAATVLGMAAICGMAMTASASDTPMDNSADGFSIQAEQLDDLTQLNDVTQLSNYSVSVSTAKAKVGSQTTLNVTVKATGNFKGNPKYPHKIKGISGSNVDAPSKVSGSASGKTISFSIPVTPKASGSHAVTGQIRFGICDESQCLMKTAQLSATVVGT